MVGFPHHMPIRNSKSTYTLVLLSLFSAVLCAISIPNEIFLKGLWPVGFFSLVPLYLALVNSDTNWRAAFTGAVFGAGEHAATSFWLFYYKGYAFWTLGTTTIAYAFVYALLGMYLSFFLRNARYSRTVIFALVWTSFEFLKSNGFLGYPWGLIPYSLTSMPIFLQIVDITGVYGLSFVLSSASGIIAEFMQNFIPLSMRDVKFSRNIRVSFIWIALFAIVAGYGWYKLITPIETAGHLRIAMIQQDTDPWAAPRAAGEGHSMQSNMELARKATEKNLKDKGKPINLFVFSETSFQLPYPEYKDWFKTNPKDNPVLPFLETTGASLLTGAPVIVDWASYSATNSAILISPKGQLMGSYAKIHPVPFAEAIPFWEYKWFRDFMRKNIGIESGWVMGTKVSTFSLSSQPGSHGLIHFGTPICFEDAFSGLCREYFQKGADLLINLTNDGWSTKKSAQIQHWAIARFRAIENRRTMVRSTNTGLSCIIDAKGNNILELPQFVPDFAIADVPIYKQMTATIYYLWGDWFPALTLLLTALEFIYCVYRLRKSKE
jgi:apolipoprotein N-acyltransferase